MCWIIFTAQADSNSTQAVPSQISLDIPSLVHHTRPEEDILFQWRLRRKIEQAQSLQHSALHGPVFSWHPPILSHPSASGGVYKVGLLILAFDIHHMFFIECLFRICLIIEISSFICHLQQQQSSQPLEFSPKVTQPHVAAPLSGTTEPHTPCPPASNPHPFPASSDSQPQAIGHVPAHMHLLCDVLPCPMQSSHSRGQQSSHNIDEFPTKFVHKKTQITGDSTPLSDMPISERIPSPSPARQDDTEAQERSYHKGSERKKKETGQIEESERKITVSVEKRKKSRSEIEMSAQHTNSNLCVYVNINLVMTDVLRLGNSQMSLQTGFPQITKLPQRSRQREGRSLPVRDAQAITGHQDLQSTVP